jgi:hypothetical protein
MKNMLLVWDIIVDDRTRCQMESEPRTAAIDQPGGLDKQPDQHQDRKSRGVLGIPAAVVDDMRKVKGACGAGRRRIETAGEEDLCLEVVGDFVMDTGGVIQDKIGK